MYVQINTKGILYIYIVRRKIHGNERTVVTEAIINFQTDTGTHCTLLQSIAFIQFLSITH